MQGNDIFPIPGTKRTKYLEQNVAAYEISKTLTQEEIAELEAAVPQHEVRPCRVGARVNPALMQGWVRPAPSYAAYVSALGP